MSILESFDLGVKKTLVPDYRFHLCYEINGNNYEAYEDNVSWDCFVNYMINNHPTAYNDYGAGSGGELRPKNGKPPKMASFASSSRLIYTLAKHKSGFVFEKKLPFTIKDVRTTPNLDGFMKKENEYIFVEAKCREIYSSHEVVSVSEKYHDLYDFLSNSECDFSYTKYDKKENGKKDDEKKDNAKVTFLINNKPIMHFDLKQMICHLSGIAETVLNGKYPDKPISFKYLLFNPTNIAFDIKYEDKIKTIYNNTLEEAKVIDMKNLFAVILAYFCIGQRKQQKHSSQQSNK